MNSRQNPLNRPARPFHSALLTGLGLLVISFGLVSCQTSDGSDAITASDALPGLEVLESGWNTLEPGMETTCSDGSDYKFFVRTANPQKLLVYFQGGGGCWTGATCSQDRLGSYTPVVGDTDPAAMGGIFDYTNPENPFADHSVVFVPYCTGDVHLGDTERTYQVTALDDPSHAKEGANPAAHEVTIQHRGHKNSMTVLDWVKGNYQPDSIFVTGSSAGSIPSPYYAALLKTQYPEAAVTQLGDGSGGYRRDAGGPMPYTEWATLDAIDAHVAYQNLNAEGFDYEALYTVAGEAHPDLTLASYDTAEDSVQIQFINIGTPGTASLQPLLDANLADISSVTTNFSSFVAGGDLHVILPRPEFYTYAAEGVRVRDWVTDLAEGRPVESVHCSDCSAPELISSGSPETSP